MNKLPITNIKQWKKGHGSRYIYFKNNKNNPTHVETIYFNYNIFHFFTRIQFSNKEGIQIRYTVRNANIIKNLYMVLTKDIKSK